MLYIDFIAIREITHLYISNIKSSNLNIQVRGYLAKEE